MNYARLIPFLTLIGDGAFKTRQFQEPRYVGDPANTVALLSSFECEELVVLDISSQFNTSPVNNAILCQIIENAFMPIAFGGGIRSIADATRAFDLGFDKVILRTELENVKLIDQIVVKYGSQAVTGCLDVSYKNSEFDATINGKFYEKSKLTHFLERLQKMGIGELVVQDVNRDGTRLGMRQHFVLEQCIQNFDFPIVAVGGCNSVEEAAIFVHETQCHSVGASTMFLFRPTRNAILVSYPSLDDWHGLLDSSDL